jgi:hypothetical protein
LQAERTHEKKPEVLGRFVDVLPSRPAAFSADETFPFITIVAYCLAKNISEIFICREISNTISVATALFATFHNYFLDASSWFTIVAL